MRPRANATRMIAAVAAVVVLLMALAQVAGWPAAAQVSGNSYTNPTYGYSLTWDDTVWTVDTNGTGDLTLTAGDVSVTLQSGQFYSGDATACRDDLLQKLPGADNVESVRPYNGGEGISGESNGRAFATSQVQLSGSDGGQSQVVETIDCRTLVDGEAVLAIISTAPVSQFDAAYATIQTLLGTLSIPAFASANDVEGVSGSTYTDPTYGFQIAWDSSIWSYTRPVGGVLGLNDTQSVVNFDTPQEFAGDLGACIGGTRQTIQANPALQQLADLTINGAPVRGSDQSGWSYAAYSADYGGATRFVEVRCATIGDGDTVLRAVFTGPADAYAAEADRADPVFASLRLAGQAAAPGAATPGSAMPNAATPNAATPGAATPNAAPSLGATPAATTAPAASPSPAVTATMTAPQTSTTAPPQTPTTTNTPMPTEMASATTVPTETATLAPTSTATATVPSTATATTAPPVATATTPATATTAPPTAMATGAPTASATNMTTASPSAASQAPILPATQAPPPSAATTPSPTASAQVPASPEAGTVAAGADGYAAADRSWSIQWDGATWTAADAYSRPDTELALGTDASVFTFATASLPTGNLADAADRLATDDVVAAGTSLRDVHPVAPPSTGGIAGATGVAYRFVTQSGAQVVESVVLVPLNNGRVLVIHVYSTPDGYAADGPAIATLLANLAITG